jgi:hypothetical protein
MKLLKLYFIAAITVSASGLSAQSMIVSDSSPNPGDTVIVAKVIRLDEAKFVNSMSKIGLGKYFVYFHLIVEADNGKRYTLLKVVNWLDEAKAYQASFDLQPGKKYLFYTYRFDPCPCDLPRVTGHCDGEVFIPDEGRVISKYEGIFRIIGFKDTK